MSRTNLVMTPPVPRRPSKVSLSEPLLLEAQALSINVSLACERGLSIEVAETKARIWLQENRSAIDIWNEHVERHGLPLADFRQF